MAAFETQGRFIKSRYGEQGIESEDASTQLAIARRARAVHDNTMHNELIAAGADGDAACLAQDRSVAERRFPAAARGAAIQHARVIGCSRPYGCSCSCSRSRTDSRILLSLHREARTIRSCCSAAAPASPCRPRDATTVRFTVGPQAETAGIVPGDHILAIYGLPLPPSMPVNEETLAEHANDPAYIAMGNLLFGTDESEVPLTVRDPRRPRPRRDRHYERAPHRRAARRRFGISPRLLSFIDLLHVLAYPFLLWAAWLLHRRNSSDVVSSIFSLAVLLNIAAEQPSSVFLATIGVPRRSTSRSTISGTSSSSPGSCCSRTAICRGGASGIMPAFPCCFFLHGHDLREPLSSCS